MIHFILLLGCGLSSTLLAQGEEGSGRDLPVGIDPAPRSSPAEDPPSSFGKARAASRAPRDPKTAQEDPARRPAFRPNPKFASLADNTALDLGKYASNPLGPEGETPPIRITDYSRFTYDRKNHQLLMFGGGHASTPRTDVDVFDFATLAWKSAYPPTPVADLRMANRDSEKGAWTTTGHPIARHTYDAMPFAENTGELILLCWVNAKAYFTQGDDYILRKVRIAHYDPRKRTWTWSKSDTSGFEEANSAEYDPVSGLIVLLDRGGLWTYDPVTQSKEKRLDHRKPLGYANNLVYFPPNQRMYFFNRNDHSVWEVALDRADFGRSTLTKLEFTGTYPPHGEPGFAYDPVGRIIGGAVQDGRFYAFDPAARTWTDLAIQGGAPGKMAFHCIDYDPVDNVFIFLSDAESGGRTWAYRHRAAK